MKRTIVVSLLLVTLVTINGCGRQIQPQAQELLKQCMAAGKTPVYYANLFGARFTCIDNKPIKGDL